MGLSICRSIVEAHGGRLWATRCEPRAALLQFTVPVTKVGMVAEATCISKPWTPGSRCVANAYTSNHELISSRKLGSFKSFALHLIDATGFVHALLLRIQALVLPIRTLVPSGH
jgi:hypothetical protein